MRMQLPAGGRAAKLESWRAEAAAERAGGGREWVPFFPPRFIFGDLPLPLSRSLCETAGRAVPARRGKMAATGYYGDTTHPPNLNPLMHAYDYAGAYDAQTGLPRVEEPAYISIPRQAGGRHNGAAPRQQPAA